MSLYVQKTIICLFAAWLSADPNLFGALTALNSPSSYHGCARKIQTEFKEQTMGLPISNVWNRQQGAAALHQFHLIKDRYLSPGSSFLLDLKSRRKFFSRLKNPETRPYALSVLAPLLTRHRQVRSLFLKYFENATDIAMACDLLLPLIPLASDYYDVFLSVGRTFSKEASRYRLMDLYIPWRLLKKTAEKWPQAWPDSRSYAQPTEAFYVWLSAIHASSHRAYIQWKDALVIDGTPISWKKMQPLPRRISRNLGAIDISTWTSEWFGRSLLVDDKHGPGATIYKIHEPQSQAEDFNTEATLWNYLHPSLGRFASTGTGRLLDAPQKNAPRFWCSLETYQMLIYHVDNRKDLLTYPSDWKPSNPRTLINWLENLVTQLGRLAKRDYFYVGLLEYWHDRAARRFYDLSASPVGCLDNIAQTFKHANIRSDGLLVDLNPRHMIATDRPTAAEAAEGIRDQAFQIALTAAWVVQQRGWKAPQLARILTQVGHHFAKVYDSPDAPWKRLPVAVSIIAEEALGALSYSQNGDMGFNSGPFSAPGLVAYAETVSQSIVANLLAKPDRKEKCSQTRLNSARPLRITA